ncbi:hypothetical protein D3C73_980940 [compost metagenome]
MEINAVIQLGEALHAGSGAAPEMVKRRAVNLEIPRSHRLKIHRHACIRVLRGQDRINEGIFVEIHIFGLAGNLVQLAAQLQHIVGVTGLSGEIRAFRIQNIRVAEVLPLTVTAGHIAVMADDHIPELLHGLQIKAFTIPQHPVPVQRPEEFGDRGVGVSALQNIPSLMDRREQAKLVEAMRSLQVARVARDFVQLIQAIIHPPVLHGQDPLLNFRRPARAAPMHPVAQSVNKRKGGFAACRIIYSGEACDNLMHRVPWHPGGLLVLYVIK